MLLVCVGVNARAVPKAVLAVEEDRESGKPEGAEGAGSASRLGERQVQGSSNENVCNVHLEAR